MSLRPSHFWLRLFQLNEAFESYGRSQDERLSVVSAELAAMPPEVRQQSVERLKQLTQVWSNVAALSNEPR